MAQRLLPGPANQGSVLHDPPPRFHRWAGAAAIAGPAVLRAQEVTTIKMGALKLIHSIAPHFYEKFTPAGYKVEVIPFESPTEGKNAVVTKSVDFGMFGIAAATLGAAAGEPSW